MDKISRYEICKAWVLKISTRHLISREYKHQERAVREKLQESKFIRIPRIKILAWLYFYNIEFCGQNGTMQQNI